LKCAWTFGREAKDVTAPDGRVVEFPKGSKVLQCKYDIGDGSTCVQEAGGECVR
jgi:hypothetical protein